MKKHKFSFLFSSFTAIIIFIFLIFVSAVIPPKESTIIHKPIYAENVVQSQDTVSVLLFSKASDYFIYKGTPAGFQYEMLVEFGKERGKKMDIKVESNPNIVYQAILSGEYDIVTMDFKRNPLLDYYLTFSTSHSQSYPVLIGKNQILTNSTKALRIGVSSLFPAEINLELLPTGTDAEIIYHEGVTTEELFEKVENGEEDYIVCDYIDAVAFLTYFDELEMIGAIGAEFDRQWNLKSINQGLNQELNQWLFSFKEGRKYAGLCRKYFNPNSSVINQSFARAKYNKISPFDQIVKKHADKQGLDWRFVTSIMYQETKFHTDLTGMGGSFGIMQLMPVTGAYYGVNPESPVEEQIAAGIRYMAKLNRVYRNIEDDDERMKFVAAAYNSGPGHINDAQRLCEKYGEDSQRWDNVAKYLALKSKKEYSKDPVVKHGLYPGSHTVKYAYAVSDRYQAYLAAIPE